MDIILASSSPAKKELLSTVIKDFYVVPSILDEDKIKQTESNPEKLAKLLSLKKADTVFGKTILQTKKQGIIIATDTLVSLDGDILGKPKDRLDAINMLFRLQGRQNDVYTGMTVIIKKEATIITETVVTHSIVYFKSMTHTQIIEYVDTNEPFGKAGSYAIQGEGKKYMRGYDGNYNAIIGLNTEQLRNVLTKYEVFEDNTINFKEI